MFVYAQYRQPSRMLNVTARLAIEIKNLLHWVIDWTDNAPQRDPASLTISDLLPSEADGQELTNELFSM